MERSKGCEHQLPALLAFMRYSRGASPQPRPWLQKTPSKILAFHHAILTIACLLQFRTPNRRRAVLNCLLFFCLLLPVSEREHEPAANDTYRKRPYNKVKKHGQRKTLIHKYRQKTIPRNQYYPHPHRPELFPIHNYTFQKDCFRARHSNDCPSQFNRNSELRLNCPSLLPAAFSDNHCVVARLRPRTMLFINVAPKPFSAKDISSKSRVRLRRKIEETATNPISRSSQDTAYPRTH